MALARPVVSIYQFDNPSEKKGGIALPHVLASPLRPDWVRRVFKDVSKNKRQPYGVQSKAGYETAAESWGTGRAVARVPRAPGGGTHRSGQGAFGNMCRGGGMFSPTKTWRRWHRRVNLREKRNAVVTALAASCLPPLVMARGHRIEEVAELPLVISDGIESICKTKATVRILEKLGFKDEMEKLNNTRKIRAGKGKTRNRRYTKRIGPMIIYNEDNGIKRATQNIIGIQACDVRKMNILELAPGGNFGRCLIWTESAFRKLHDIYGTLKSGCPMKKRYTLPRAQMENADIARIINSTEVQSVLRPKLEKPKTYPKKINALKNKREMKKLNPYEKPVETDEQRKKRVAERKAKSKEYNKKYKRGDDTFFKKLMRAYEPKKEEAEEEKEAESEGE